MESEFEVGDYVIINTDNYAELNGIVGEITERIGSGIYKIVSEEKHNLDSRFKDGKTLIMGSHYIFPYDKLKVIDYVLNGEEK